MGGLTIRITLDLPASDGRSVGIVTVITATSLELLCAVRPLRLQSRYTRTVLARQQHDFNHLEHKAVNHTLAAGDVLYMKTGNSYSIQKLTAQLVNGYGIYV